MEKIQINKEKRKKKNRKKKFSVKKRTFYFPVF